MSVAFKKNCILVLIFSDTLTDVILKETDGKMDGFFYTNKSEVDVVKLINEETKLTLETNDLRMVTTLQNVSKEWKIDVYMVIANTNTINFTKSLKSIKTNNLDVSCHPNLKWLIPLSIDISVYGSGFNQILMK